MGLPVGFACIATRTARAAPMICLLICELHIVAPSTNAWMAGSSGGLGYVLQGTRDVVSVIWLPFSLDEAPTLHASAAIHALIVVNSL